MIKDEQKQSCHPEVPEARQYGSHQELSVVAKEVAEPRQYGSKQELSVMTKEVPEAQQNSVILRERSDRRILSKIKGFFANAQNARAYCPIALKKRVAFTLAEVLITLGIIGVVAAVTIPMLVKDYQKQQWVNGLRVGVSIIQNAFKQMMADENVDYLASTEFLISKCDSQRSLNDAEVQKCSQILSKYFKIINAEPIVFSHSGCDFNKNGFRQTDKSTNCVEYRGSGIFTLANGMSLNFSAIDRDYLGDDFIGDGYIRVYLDVNGTKQGPNTYGRDVQLLFVTNNGVVTGSCDDYAPCDTAYLNKLHQWQYQDCVRWAFDDEDAESCSSFLRPLQTFITIGSRICPEWNGRQFCATRIMNNGWKMDY